MVRFNHGATPLALLGLLALAGCPGDDVPIETDDSSTGDSPPPPTTGIDPDSGSGDLPTGPSPTCEPQCPADRCCVDQACIDAPEPTCDPGCDPGRLCLCPPDSDPCDCEGQCVACGTEDGGYDPCFDRQCPADAICLVDDPMNPTVAVCAPQGCGDDPCACPVPGEGTAVNRCDDFDGDDGLGSCVLDCAAGLCPEGMFCRDFGDRRICAWPDEGTESNCCGAHDGLGCDIGSCQAAVCALDAFCCDSGWDELCAEATVTACPGLCPAERPWGDCVNGLPCEPGMTCVGDDVLGWCAPVDCVGPADCPPAPATGTAPIGCEPILEGGQTACVLDCSTGAACPDGMLCTPEGWCAWQAPVPGFANCGLGPCALGEVCLDDGVGMMADPTWSVCSQPGCADATECAYLLPSTGDAPVACGDPTGTGAPDTCTLDCSGGQTCPDGMDCIGGNHCAWPQGTTLFADDFQTGGFMPGAWTLVDADGQIPNVNVDFVTDAWIVSDLGDEAGVDLSAVSTSWYEPVGQADDWLITRSIEIGPDARVYWTSRSFDAMFPDGYELRISTATDAPADFLVDPPLLSVAAESGSDTARFIDLAPAGYMDRVVHLAWRNVTNDGYLLLVDDVFVVDLP